MLARLRASRFLRHIAILAGGTAAGQALSVASAPILTRLYSPASMGQWGLYAAFLAFAAILTTLAYELAIVSARTPAEVRALLRATVKLLLPGGLVCAAILYMVIDGERFGFSILPTGAALLALVALVIGGAAALLRAALIQGQYFVAVARSQVSQSAGRVGGQIAFGLAGYGWLGLAAGDIIGKAVGAVHMLVDVRRAPPLEPSQLRERSWPVLKRHWRYPLFITPSSLVDALAQNLPLPIIASLYGPAGAGHFALAQRILSVPSALVGASIADVFHTRLAERRHTDPASAPTLLYRTAALLAGVGAVPALILVLAAPPLFQWLFGAEWRPAGEIASILAILSVAQLVVSPLSRTVAVYDGQHLKLVYDALSLLGGGAVFVASRHWHLDLQQTVIAFTATQLIAYGYYFFAIVRLVSHKRG